LAAGESRVDDRGKSAKKLPPIECPLRKAGIDPRKLRPFREVEKYIKFLERPQRAEWQKPDEVVKTLKLKGTETVVDLGAGSGYFTFRLAKAVPRGLVWAIDSQPEMVRYVHRKIVAERWRNVRAKVCTEEDPRLPTDVNLVFVCNVLMHVRKKRQWLRTIWSQMPRGSRLVLIEFREGHLPEGPPESIKVPKKEILQLCRCAGFVLERDLAPLLPYQSFLVFKKP